MATRDAPTAAKRLAPDNALALPYVPHSRVLPAARLAICHAGHGIVMKAMTYGVPLVLVSLGRDQPGVAARAAAAGVAEVIDGEDRRPEQVAAAIRLVMDDARYRAASARITRRIRSARPVARVIELVEEVAADTCG